MKQPKAEAQRWLAQARSDLGFAELGLREGYRAQACFMAQPTAEKALKALHDFAGARVVLGHSVVAALRESGQQLDQFYVPTRYPNGLPGGVPAQVFSRAQSEPAVAGARKFVETAEALVG